MTKINNIECEFLFEYKNIYDEDDVMCKKYVFIMPCEDCVHRNKKEIITESDSFKF